MKSDNDLAALTPLIDSMQVDAAALTSRVITEVVDEIDVYRGETIVAASDLRESAHRTIIEMLTALAKPHDPPVTTVAGAAHRRAEQGFPLPAMLHAFRIAGRRVLSELIASARRHALPAVDTRSLLTGAQSIWMIIDEFSRVLADAYHDQTAEMTRLHAEHRRAAIDAVLAGYAASNPGFFEAATTLRFPTEGAFVALVADLDATEHAERAAAAAVTGYGGCYLWRVATGYQIGVIFLGPTITYPQFRQTLSDIPGPGRIGISPPYAQLVTTPGAVRLADIARRCRAPNSSGLTAVQDNPLRALLVTDPQLGWRATRSLLAPILRQKPASAAMLLCTLRAFFDADGSITEAARALSCHRNTVTNRLQRIQDLTGHHLDTPQAQAELYLAIQAIELVAPPHVQARLTPKTTA